MRPNTTATVIPTTYNGILFRSRLEARWAVFLDEMGLSWQYEPEGFTRNGVGYLPDFWLPKLDCYLEIKPCCPSEEEVAKAWIAVDATGKDLFFFWGTPAGAMEANEDERGAFGLWRVARGGSAEWEEEEVDDEGNVVGMFVRRDPDRTYTSDERWWAHCPACGTVGIVYFGATENLHCCPKNPGHSCAPIDDEKIVNAARSAMAFRFWDPSPSSKR